MKHFTKWFRRAEAPMLDCDSVMRQLWDFLDGELTPERTEAIRQHVEMCSRCKPQTEFEREFLAAVAKSQREYPNSEQLRDNLVSALRERGFAPG
ncbi:MAG: zf-HC2 domain-containing protein [Gemmatimonadaceae bacterium]